MKLFDNILTEALDELDFDRNFEEITDFDKREYADDADWDSDNAEAQEIGSEKTSVKQVPRTFNPESGIRFKPNTFNFDLGGGKHDLGTQALMNGVTCKGKAYVGQQVTNLIFDPYSRESDFNNATLDKIEELGGADTVTVNNCLNVIKGRKFIENVIRQACEVVKPDGEVVFQIYSRNKDNIGAPTKSGYQQNKKAEKYVPLIHKWFNKIWIDNSADCIIAKEPHFDITDRVPFYPDKNGEPRYLNIQRESINKDIIKLTESDLHKIIMECVNNIKGRK